MPRRPRVDYAGAIHHVMNRGVAHQRTFFTDQDRTDFGVQLAAVHERFGLEVLAYCLMDNHYHLLVRTPDGGLAAAMQHLGHLYTRHTNDRVGRDGPLFRGRYHSIAVSTVAYLLGATRYIHRNALDILGVRAPADYRWSSYRAYLGFRRVPSFLRTDVVLDLFGDDRHALARFTETDEPFDRAAPATTVADLLQYAQLALATDELERSDQCAPTGTLRSALVLLTERLPAGPLQAALDQHLAFPTIEARQAAVRRATHRPIGDGVERVVRAVLADVRVEPTIGV